ncbi:glycoside hydrolase family 28 protein [Carboxylicivirga linearis]|uniref:Glycoside hydrolase family 28 protein n=1 Tax=Carboxylicivirga linearis TaxID=1628157 RepID=A0ABS5JZ47_9BACT|nr:glycoside hydrolase family 28 protein [Carboxylicivirga linearis]MBS2100173.1 glycoside hydrolase family 28 protein [Carboxylicivirga linearis]
MKLASKIKLVTSIGFLLLLMSNCGILEKSNTKQVENNKLKIINRIKLPNIGSTTFNLADYNAVSDGLTDCKPIIDSLIKVLSSRAGGKLIIPKGVFFCKGPIKMESHINLHLEDGATLLFSQNSKDYLPLQLVRWEGVEVYNYSPYIYAKDKIDIAITGKGTLNGNAEGGIATWRPLQKEAQNTLRKMGKEQIPVQEREFGEGHYLRPSFIQFFNCQNILISDITIENVPFWVVHPTYCKNITIRNININSSKINNDGIDMDSCEDALIENCVFINSGDDAIAIKSGRDNDAWRVNRPSKNIVVRNCIAEKVLHGIAFGSEMSGGIESIYVENIALKHVRGKAIQFKSNKDRGGYIRNIFIDGVYIDTTRIALYFTNDYHSYAGGNSPADYHHITIKNLICNYATDNSLNIKGLDEQPIHDVFLENFLVLKENLKSKINNVKDFNCKNVIISGEALESIVKKQ